MRISEGVKEFFEKHRPPSVRLTATEVSALAAMAGMPTIAAVGDGQWELRGVCGTTLRFSPEEGLTLNWEMNLSLGNIALFGVSLGEPDLQAFIALALKAKKLPWRVSVPVLDEGEGILVVLVNKSEQDDLLCFSREVALGRIRHWRSYGEPVPVLMN